MVDATNKTPVEAAAFADAVAREQRLTAFRAGNLGFVDAEQLTAELCAAGDADIRERERLAEKALREAGARLRAGAI
jgi:hypothetical protein